MAVEVRADASGTTTESGRAGAILAIIMLCVYGGLAISVDFPRAAIGIQSDEATYYMMGHSLVEDFDLAYRKQDLVRVWKEFPGGHIMGTDGRIIHPRVDLEVPA